MISGFPGVEGNLIVLSSRGKRKKELIKLLAIDTELPIVERFTVLPIIQKLLAVFDLITLLFLLVRIYVCVC